METAQFKNQFLLAMPGRVGGQFADSVALIAEHNDDGALGLVINKPIEMTVSQMLSQLDIAAHVRPGERVYWGGPVATEHGFVLHADDGSWQSTLRLDGGLAITTSRDILEAIGNGFGPADYLITLGYSGWGGGQLESELLENSWLTVPADQRIIFESPTQRRWGDAAGLLGLSAHQISGLAGHA